MISITLLEDTENLPVALFIWCRKLLLKTAPKIAAPRLCPKLREKMLALVTTPRCCHGTIDCTPTMDGVDSRPNPAPISAWSITRRETGCGRGNNRKPTVAAKTNTAPMREVSRKPIRRYNFPESADAVGHPMLILARINPEAITPTPRDTCVKVGKNVSGPIITIPIPTMARLVKASVLFFHSQAGMMASADFISVRNAHAPNRSIRASSVMLGSENQGHPWPPSNRKTKSKPRVHKIRIAPL